MRDVKYCFGFVDAIDRANLLTLGFIIMAYTFCAFIGVDNINFIARCNCFVRAFGFTYITVDALFGNNKCQGQLPENPNWSLRASSISVPTNWDTSPRRRATSRTNVDEINPYFSSGVRNMVSTSSQRLRFMLAN